MWDSQAGSRWGGWVRISEEGMGRELELCLEVEDIVLAG